MNMTVAEYKVQISNVSKVFGPKPMEALKLIKSGTSKEEIQKKTGNIVGVYDVSLGVLPGEIFVIMGLSGSGKSTLIRHVNRLIEPTSGNIFVDGVDVMRMSNDELREFRRHRLSMVFQRFGLLPHRQVLDNVAYGLSVRGLARKQCEERAQHWIEQVGLLGFENCYPSELSGGMQQRVGLARALATDPDILLMDEAFSALDPLIRNDMQQQLLELQRTLHKTILFITHDLEEALRLGDRIAILKDGEVKQIGTPEQILLKPADKYIERFVRDVNRARILTAGSIMDAVPTMKVSELTTKSLREKINANELKLVYMLEDDGRLAGVFIPPNTKSEITAAAAKRNLCKLPHIDVDAVIEEVAILALNSSVPIPVVCENGKFKGAISQSAAMSALVRSKV